MSFFDTLSCFVMTFSVIAVLLGFPVGCVTSYRVWCHMRSVRRRTPAARLLVTSWSLLLAGVGLLIAPQFSDATVVHSGIASASFPILAGIACIVIGNCAFFVAGWQYKRDTGKSL